MEILHISTRIWILFSK